MLQHWADVNTTSSATVAWMNAFVLLCISALCAVFLDSISQDWFKERDVQFNVNFLYFESVLKLCFIFYNIQPTPLSIYALDR